MTHPILAAARDIRPVLQALVPEVAATGGIPAPMREAMIDSGAYRMVAPQEFGGAAVDLETFLAVLEAIAEGCGAAGWNLATSSAVSLFLNLLPAKSQATIYGDGPDVPFAGSAAPPNGRARRVEGGFEVTGRWRFGSGCEQARWMAGACLEAREQGGDALPSGPGWFMAVVPRADVTVHEGWDVLGLRGTGSHDWSIDGRFVPADFMVATLPFFQWPTGERVPLAAIAALHFSAVATGLARRSIGALLELAGHKVPMGAPSVLRDRPQVQEAVGRAEATLEAGRAYRTSIVRETWALAQAGEIAGENLRARLRLAGTFAVESATRVVDLMFNAGGTTGIDLAHPLAHCFADIHVIANNINVLPIWYPAAGRLLMDLEPGTYF